MLFRLAYKSLSNRKTAVLLTITSIMVGVMLLLGFAFIKDQVRSSFAKTISGIDLIVGAKTSDVNLLLYAVFHVGTPTNNISWEGYQRIQANPWVAATIPVSLGDSHRGFRVIGTDQTYFKHYQYGNKQSLTLRQGYWFDHPFEVVLGHEVATKLGYSLGHSIHLSHGVSQTSFKQHDEVPFMVAGILNPTGTPIDQSLFIDLTGLEAVHLNWPRQVTEQQRLKQQIIEHGLTPKSITAVFLTLNNKSSTFVLQRQINQDEQEPLQAILPGVALAQLWKLSKMFEQTLWLVGLLVLVSTLIGLINMLIASLQARKKELALLRVIGASPMYCFLLIQLESIFVVFVASALAIIFSYGTFFLLGDWLGKRYGFFIDINAFFGVNTWLILALLLVITITLVCLPASMFYRQSMVKNINQ